MTSPSNAISIRELKGAITERLPPVGQAAASAAVLLPTIVLFFVRALPWTAEWGWSWNVMLRLLWQIATSGAIGAYFVIAVALFARDPKRRHLAVIVAGAAVVVDLAMVVLETWMPSGYVLRWFWALTTVLVAVTVVAAWGIARRTKPIWMAGLAPTFIAAFVLLDTPIGLGSASSWYGYWFRYVVVVGLGCACCWGFEAIASASAANVATANGLTPAPRMPEPDAGIGYRDVPADARADAPAPGPVPPGNGQQMAYSPVQPVAQTNSMAIAALVSSLVMAPLGVVFGHISLSQIRRTGEQGKGLAIAGLVIGYLGTALLLFYVIAMLVFFGWLRSSIDGFNSEISSYTTTTTTPSRTLVGTANPTSTAIRNAEVGDCIQRTKGASNSDGTRSVQVEGVSCSSSLATDRVTKITDDINDCGSQWVRTTVYSPPIVLCLVTE